MNNFHKIDMAAWPRSELFNFYRSFASPAFNISVKLDAENIKKYAKANQESFFLISLYAILRAANDVPQIRHRIIDDSPVEFEKIAAMTPVMTKHEMFAQAWCEYEKTFPAFKDAVSPLIEAAANGLPAAREGEYGEDFICASCVPWLHFESITQADASFGQSIPILAWGKIEDGKIPFSVRFNHCFIDGLHVSRFFENIQNSFNNPDILQYQLRH